MPDKSLPERLQTRPTASKRVKPRYTTPYNLNKNKIKKHRSGLHGHGCTDWGKTGHYRSSFFCQPSPHQFLSCLRDSIWLIQSKSCPSLKCGGQDFNYFFRLYQTWFRSYLDYIAQRTLITGIIIPVCSYVFLFFWYSRDGRYFSMSCICILFFAIQRHLCPNIGTNVISRQAKTTFGSVRNAQVFFFLANLCNSLILGARSPNLKKRVEQQ